jgi:hypothetical protein
MEKHFTTSLLHFTFNIKVQFNPFGGKILIEFHIKVTTAPH